MTFFRTCVYLCVGLIALNVCLTLFGSLGIFPEGLTPAAANVTSPTDSSSTGLTNILFSSFTRGLGIAGITTMLITLGGAVGLTYLTRSLVPVAIGAFASVFWVSYNGAFTTFNQMGIPAGFLAIITIVFAFFFIGAVIGMASGSG
jgi:hypothetical protein